MALTIRKRQRLVIRIHPKTKAARLFERYQRVACSAARTVARKCGRPYVEMSEEAISKLAEMATTWDDGKTYDPFSSSPVTWIYTKIYWYLRELCNWKIRHHEHNEVPDTIPQHRSWYERLHSELSEEGRKLLDIVVTAPGDLSRDFRCFRANPARARVGLMHHLRNVEGWSEEEIDKAWTEIETCLS